jgi:hypothetical protein
VPHIASGGFVRQWLSNRWVEFIETLSKYPTLVGNICRSACPAVFIIFSTGRLYGKPYLPLKQKQIESDQAMWTKIKIAVLLVILGLLSFYTATRVTAAPSPPSDVVNHATKECAQIWTGDECRTCRPATGWEVLIGRCPDGYTVLDHPAPTDCALNASSYCCGTVNSEWIGCVSYPGYRPPISLWVIPVGITIIGVLLFVWAKKRTGQSRM